MNLNNYWLSGFSDADASFQINLLIEIINRSKIKFSNRSKKDDLLILIKTF